jgi:hypothetical protein
VQVSGPSGPNAFGLAQSATPDAGHLLIATIDERDASNMSEFGWTPVQVNGGDMNATLAFQFGTVVSTTWKGTIPNAPTAGGGKTYRVRVEEFEQFQADPGYPTGLRPVYLDTFLLSI